MRRKGWQLPRGQLAWDLKILDQMLVTATTALLNRINIWCASPCEEYVCIGARHELNKEQRHLHYADKCFILFDQHYANEVPFW